MNSGERNKIVDELAPLRAARVPLEAVRWTHGRKDGPIALVTGPGSRARADFSSGLKQTARYVRVEYFLARLDDPSAVAAAIRRAKDAPGILVIAVCRGGGDEHDLSVFSHPDVVRAVAEAASIRPVVTGIGHTEDHCLADDYASRAAALPYAAGEVIHQARQSAWRRLQPEPASWRYSRAALRPPLPRRRPWRTARKRRATVPLIVAGVFGIFLAIASCPADRQRPAETSYHLAPAGPIAQVPTKKKRSAPSPQQRPVAATRPPEEQPAPPQHPSPTPAGPPEEQPAPPPQQPAPTPARPPEDQPAAPLQEPAGGEEAWGGPGMMRVAQSPRVDR